jgi:hypothetical protein
MHKYTYEGSVKVFDDIVTRSWTGSTMAESEKKARSNLAYKYKREHGLTPCARVTLSGKILLVG